FGDPDFLNGPGHALAVARALHDEFPSLTFDVTAKIEHLLRHRDRLPELARLGCAFVVSAAESLSDTVLAHLDKGHTRTDIETAVRLVTAAGMALRPTWVPFTPWTTLDDYRELLDFVESHELIDAIDPVQYSIRLLVPPGSLLLESPALRPFLGDLVKDQFYFSWTHPDSRMEALHHEVSSAVAGAADRNQDAADTFYRVRGLADGASGVGPRPFAPPAPGRKRPPRLTEPWFC
ncbi:MAG: radical SAM protein, partial [Candidatus Rokuibacteriota bacterium]